MKRSLIIVILCLLCAIFAFGCNNKADLESGDIHVSLNPKGDKLSITVMPESEMLEKHGSSDLILLMLQPGQKFTDIGNATELGRRRADEEVSFKVALTENGKSRLYNAFTAVLFDANTNSYVEVVDSVGYVSNPEVLAGNTAEYPKTDSLKGLNVIHDSEAETLGISHAMIDLPLEEYLLPDGRADAIGFVFCGKSYYLNKDAVEELDSRVKLYTENNVNVYLRFVLRTDPSGLSGDLTCLAYADAPAGEKSYAVNMTDAKCALSVAAFADFIAERYSREDQAYGTVSAFVVGDDMNTPGKTAAPLGVEEYYRSSFAFVRTVYTAMASHSKNGRVYVDVDNLLKVKGSGACDSSAQEYLTRLAEHSRDIPWGVSASVKASSTDPDRIWYDNSGNGSYLTPSNLASFVNDVMNTQTLMYGDEMRNMIIGDFSVSVGTSDNSENNQAASYAFAYYKAIESGAFDALIYSTQSDKENDRSGLYLTNLEGEPVSKRKIHGIFCDIDTDADIDSFVGGVINDSEWTALYEAQHKTAAVKARRHGEVEQCDPSLYATSVLVDFSDGTLGGFEIVGKGSYLGLVPNSSSASLRAFLAKENAAQTPYAAKKGIKRSDIHSDNILVTLSAYGPEGSAATAFNVRIELVQSNARGMDVIYKSDVQEIAPSTTLTLAFNVEDVKSSLKKKDIELRIYAEGNDGSSCILNIDRVLAGKEKTNVLLIVLLCVLATGALIAVGALVFVWFRKNYEIQFDREAKPPKATEEKKKTPKKEKAKKKEKKPKKEKTKKKSKDKTEFSDTTETK